MSKKFDPGQTDRVTSRQGGPVVLTRREAKTLMVIGTLMGVWTVVSISYLVVKGLRAEPDGFLSDARPGESKYIDFYSSPAVKEIQALGVIASDVGQLKPKLALLPPPAVVDTKSVPSLPLDNIESKGEATPTAFLTAAGVNVNSVAASLEEAEPVTPPLKVMVEAGPAPTQPAVAIEKMPESVIAILPVSVERFYYNRAGNNLVTHFSIRNLGEKLLTGTIIAEADFVSDSGETVIVLAEESFKTKTVISKEVRFYAPNHGKFTTVRFRIKEKNVRTAEHRQLAAEFPISH